MATTTNNTSQSASVTNVLARQTLLKTAQPRDAYVLQGYALGTGSNPQLLQKKLLNVGVTTNLKLILYIQSTTAPATTQAALESQVMGLLQSNITEIQVLDFNGTKRIDIDGFGLWIFNVLRRGKADLLITTTGTASPYTYIIGVDVPLAINEDSDLTGAMFCQNNTGEWYIKIMPSATATVNIDLIQDYLYLVPIGQDSSGNPVYPLPQIDLSTVYELNSIVKSNSNLAVGVEKLIDVPVNRTLYRFSVGYYNGTTFEIDPFRLLADANTDLKTYKDPNHYIDTYRQHFIEYGMQPSIMMLNFPNGLVTNAFGQLQFGFTPITTAAGAYAQILTESTYQVGANVGGITQ